jgi:hypothetical protein
MNNRAFGRQLCLWCLGAVGLWAVAGASTSALVASVPGCRLGAKGFPIDCGWASGMIDVLNWIGFWFGAALLITVPCALLGGLVWASAAFENTDTKGDA